MAWIETHESITRHPKTMALARILKVHRREAIGLIHDLLAWGLHAAERDGLIPDLTEKDIADALSCTKAEVKALVKSGYLEEGKDGYVIHNWAKYTGKLYEIRSGHETVT